MLNVDIEKILPVTEVRDSLNKIVDEVSAGDELYVLTVNGKPSAVIVGVHHLEKLTGTSPTSLMASMATDSSNSTDDTSNLSAATANDFPAPDSSSVATTPSQPPAVDQTEGISSPVNEPVIAESTSPADAVSTPATNQAPIVTPSQTEIPSSDSVPITTGESIAPAAPDQATANDGFATPAPADINNQTPANQPPLNQ